MDELVGRVGTLEASTAAVQEDITEMKPITDDVRKWKLMGMGALAAIGIGAALGVTIADVVKRDLAVLLRGGYASGLREGTNLCSSEASLTRAANKVPLGRDNSEYV